MKLQIFMIPLLMTSFTLADKLGFEYIGVAVKTLDSNGKRHTITVKRDIAAECKKLPINNTMVWTGDYAHAKVPKECKSTYVHTTGKLLPMHL
ncbi:rhodanese-like domain-containing protein, partial [Sulfurovum lithotrophicum]